MINTITDADQISDGWDFLAAFGTGAVAGGLGAATGGAAFTAAGGAAMGGGGFLAGAAGAGIGSNVGMAVQSIGNAAFFNDPYPTMGEYLTSVALSTVIGGATNGITEASYGRNFWDGSVNFNINYPSVTVASNIPSPGRNAKLNELTRAKIDGLLDDGLPSQQSNLRIIPKTEIPSQLSKKSIVDGYRLSNHAFRKSILGRGFSRNAISSTISGAKTTGNIITEVGTGRFSGNIIKVYQHNGIKVVIDETRKSILSIRPTSGFKLP